MTACPRCSGLMVQVYDEEPHCSACSRTLDAHEQCPTCDCVLDAGCIGHGRCKPPKLTGQNLRGFPCPDCVPSPAFAKQLAARAPGGRRPRRTQERVKDTAAEDGPSLPDAHVDHITGLRMTRAYCKYQRARAAEECERLRTELQQAELQQLEEARRTPCTGREGALG